MSEHKYPGGCPFCGDQGAEIRINKRTKFYMYCPKCGPVNAGGESYHDALRRIVEGEGKGGSVRKSSKGGSVRKSSDNSVQGKNGISEKNPEASGGGFMPLVSF